MAELFANSGDPDLTPRSAASDLGLHCLPVTRLGVSSPQWVWSKILLFSDIKSSSGFCEVEQYFRNIA